jgi:hypothetical protein
MQFYAIVVGGRRTRVSTGDALTHLGWTWLRRAAAGIANR